jgi:hypothetical protein
MNISEDAVDAAEKYLAERFKWNGALLRETAREVVEATAPHLMAPRLITTAEEMEALPVGSVVAMIGSEPDSPAVACRAVRGWQFLGGDPERRYLSSSLMPSSEPVTVLHDPSK